MKQKFVNMTCTKCKKTDDNYKIPRLFIDSNMPDYKFILILILPI